MINSALHENESDGVKSKHNFDLRLQLQKLFSPA